MLRLMLQIWMPLLMPMFFGIGMGPSDSEKKEQGAAGGIGNFATSTGEGDISSASDFWKGVLSGDQTQLSRLLGPLFSNINQRAGQELKTTSEFGTRSGGTAAQQQQIGESERKQASDAEGSLLAGAASNLGNLGTGLLSTGLSAHELAFNEAKTIQDQRAAKWNDIMQSITKSIETAAVIGGG